MNPIKEKYIQKFFGNLSEKKKEDIYFNQYMWHAFSYEEVPCLVGIEAVREFAKKEKNDVYILFQFSDEVLERQNVTLEELLNDQEILGSDCYVVDKNFTWTFVLTHETIFDDVTEEDRGYNCYYIGPFYTTVKMI